MGILLKYLQCRNKKPYIRPDNLSSGIRNAGPITDTSVDKASNSAMRPRYSVEKSSTGMERQHNSIDRKRNSVEMPGSNRMSQNSVALPNSIQRFQDGVGISGASPDRPGTSGVVNRRGTSGSGYSGVADRAGYSGVAGWSGSIVAAAADSGSGLAITGVRIFYSRVICYVLFNLFC